MERVLGLPIPIPPTATDVLINRPDLAWLETECGLTRIPLPWGEGEYRTWVLQRIAEAGLSWDAKKPYVDLSLEGWRMHVVFPPASPAHILVSLRRTRSQVGSGQDRWGARYATLRSLLDARASILVSGATGAGKTTLLNDLLSDTSPADRIIVIEDTPEVAPRHPHVLSLLARSANAEGFGEITPRDLLRQTLRMRPDRIVIGECRGAEVLDLLQALNTGHRGALATVHANSARDALRRVELLCSLHGPSSIPTSTYRHLLGSSLQVVVQVEKSGPLRQISEIGRLEGLEGDTLLLRPL